jgi:hypothetical protein
MLSSRRRASRVVPSLSPQSHADTDESFRGTARAAAMPPQAPSEASSLHPRRLRTHKHKPAAIAVDVLSHTDQRATKSNEGDQLAAAVLATHIVCEVVTHLSQRLSRDTRPSVPAGDPLERDAHPCGVGEVVGFSKNAVMSCTSFGCPSQCRYECIIMCRRFSASVAPPSLVTSVVSFSPAAKSRRCR